MNRSRSFQHQRSFKSTHNFAGLISPIGLRRAPRFVCRRVCVPANYQLRPAGTGNTKSLSTCSSTPIWVILINCPWRDALALPPSLSFIGRSGTAVSSLRRLLRAVCITGKIVDSVVDIPVDNFVDKCWVWPCRGGTCGTVGTPWLTAPRSHVGGFIGCFT